MMRTILTSLFSLLVVASAASATPASIGRSNAAALSAPVEAPTDEEADEVCVRLVAVVERELG